MPNGQTKREHAILVVALEKNIRYVALEKPEQEYDGMDCFLQFSIAIYNV